MSPNVRDEVCWITASRNLQAGLPHSCCQLLDVHLLPVLAKDLDDSIGQANSVALLSHGSHRGRHALGLDQRRELVNLDVVVPEPHDLLKQLQLPLVSSQFFGQTRHLSAAGRNSFLQGGSMPHQQIAGEGRDPIVHFECSS